MTLFRVWMSASINRFTGSIKVFAEKAVHHLPAKDAQTTRQHIRRQSF